MKKTCDKCKALEDRGVFALIYTCELGYAQKDGVPLEECPKPLSTKKFVEIMLQKDKKNIKKS